MEFSDEVVRALGSGERRWKAVSTELREECSARCSVEDQKQAGWRLHELPPLFEARPPRLGKGKVVRVSVMERWTFVAVDWDSSLKNT